MRSLNGKVAKNLTRNLNVCERAGIALGKGGEGKLTSWKSDSAACQGCESNEERSRRHRQVDHRYCTRDYSDRDRTDRQWRYPTSNLAASPTLSNQGITVFQLVTV